MSGMSRIIISDIHGCFRTLKALLNRCPDLPVTIAGDLVDRGPRSIEVIEFVRERGFDCVIGNHDDMMVDADVEWLLYEGAGTYDEYLRRGVPEGTDLFSTHRRWLARLPVFRSYATEKSPDDRTLIVSHSNLLGHLNTRDGTPGDREKNLIIWNRDVIYDQRIPDDPSLYNVFGHTPCYLIHRVPPDDPRNRPIIRGHYALIDTGCAYGGFLSALIFPEMVVISQEHVD